MRNRKTLFMLMMIIAIALGSIVIGSMGLSRFAGARAASNEGWIVYSSGDDATEGLWIMDVNGENQRQLTKSRDLEPAWSPDGQKIAFARLPRGDLAPRGIYVLNADGTNMKRLNDCPYDGTPAWSPDGKRIAFSRQVREKEDVDKDGVLSIESMSIYIMKSDGTMLQRVTAETPAHWDFDPDWSPDGKKIVYQRYDREGVLKGVRIWIMDSNGDNQEMLNDTGDRPAWSPDGKKIAFSRLNPARGRDICLMNANGSNIEVLTSSIAINNTLPRWSPDGTRIIFESNRDGNYHIYIMNADGSGVHRVTKKLGDEYEPDWTAFSYAVAPNGKLKATWGKIKSGIFPH